MNVKINMSGLSEFANLLGSIADHVPEMNNEFIKESWDEFKKTAVDATRDLSGELQDSFQMSEVRQSDSATEADFMNTSIYATWINDGSRYDPRNNNVIYLKNPPDYFWEAGLRQMNATQEQRYQRKLASKFEGGG